MNTTLLPPLNRGAVSQHEPYVVVRPTENGLEIVESQMTAWKAVHAVEVLNNHEERNGRPRVYTYYHAPFVGQTETVPTGRVIVEQ